MAIEYDAIAFDCDGTLSSIEGITELARLNDCEQQVRAITEKAMSDTGINPELFKTRLDLVQPRQQQVIALAAAYYEQRTNNIEQLISELQKLQKNIYILSAGYYESVAGFAEKLNIRTDDVYAVHLQFDAQGHYKDFEQDSPLIHNNGKAAIISALSETQKIVYVGDGANDLAVKPYVEKFIGFGAHFPRENIKAQSDAYITDNDAMQILATLND